MPISDWDPLKSMMNEKESAVVQTKLNLWPQMEWSNIRYEISISRALRATPNIQSSLLYSNYWKNKLSVLFWAKLSKFWSIYDSKWNGQTFVMRLAFQERIYKVPSRAFVGEILSEKYASTKWNKLSSCLSNQYCFVQLYISKEKQLFIHPSISNVNRAFVGLKWTGTNKHLAF